MKTFCTRSLIFVAAISAILPASPSVTAHPSIELQIRQLNGEIAAEPGRPELMLRRAELYRQHQQFKEALADCDAADQLNPAAASSAWPRARLYFDMKRFDDAQNLVNAMFARGAAGAEAYLLLSQIQRAKGNIENAIESREKAIDLSLRPDPDQYIELAAMQRSSGQGIAALKTIDGGIGSLGPIVSLQLAALEMEIELGLFDAALTRVDRLESSGLEKDYGSLWRARIFLKSGRQQQAKQAFLRTRKMILARASERGTRSADQTLLSEIDDALAGSRALRPSGQLP